MVSTVAMCVALWGGSVCPAGARVIGSRFERMGGKLVPSDAIGAAGFGRAVALSGDGDTMLVGGPNDTSGAGAAWIYGRSGTGWREVTKLTNPQRSGAAGRFGAAVALSGDGNTALIAGVRSVAEGTVDVFVRKAEGWSEEATLVPQGLQAPTTQSPNGMSGPSFGSSVALSADGSTAVIGADTDTCEDCGAAVVFTRLGTTWVQQGSPLRPDDLTPIEGTRSSIGGGGFGESVALNASGSTALIGDPTDSAGCGVACFVPGAAWLYRRRDAAWSQDGVKLSDASSLLDFGWGTAEALSASGTEGVMSGTPHAVALMLSGSPKADLTSALSRYPASVSKGAAVAAHGVALSGDGNTALIGGAGGCSGDRAQSFVRSSAGWAAEPALDVVDAVPELLPLEAYDVALSSDGETAVIADPLDDYSVSASSGVGAVWTYRQTSSPFVIPEVRKVITQGTPADGVTVTVTGRGFTGVTAVTLRGTAAASFCLISSTKIVMNDVQTTGDIPSYTPTNVVVSSPAGNSLQALVPGAVTRVRARAEQHAALVTFSPPHRTGFPISYTVHALPSGPTVRTRRDRVTVHGLRDGRVYRFVVTAGDRFGAGPISRPSNRVRLISPGGR